MELRPTVYIAGPYTTGNMVTNTTTAIKKGDELLELGFSPFVPHLSHYWDILHTAHDYETWMELDLPWVAKADYVYRLPGISAGADREVALAKELGIPVVYSMKELALLEFERSEGIG